MYVNLCHMILYSTPVLDRGPLLQTQTGHMSTYSELQAVDTCVPVKI